MSKPRTDSRVASAPSRSPRSARASARYAPANRGSTSTPPRWARSSASRASSAASAGRPTRSRANARTMRVAASARTEPCSWARVTPRSRLASASGSSAATSANQPHTTGPSPFASSTRVSSARARCARSAPTGSAAAASCSATTASSCRAPDESPSRSFSAGSRSVRSSRPGVTTAATSSDASSSSPAILVAGRHQPERVLHGVDGAVRVAQVAVRRAQVGPRLRIVGGQRARGCLLEEPGGGVEVGVEGHPAGPEQQRVPLLRSQLLGQGPLEERDGGGRGAAAYRLVGGGGEPTRRLRIETGRDGQDEGGDALGCAAVLLQHVGAASAQLLAGRLRQQRRAPRPQRSRAGTAAGPTARPRRRRSPTWPARRRPPPR